MAGAHANAFRVGMIGVAAAIAGGEVVPIGSFEATAVETFESIGGGRIRGAVRVFDGAGFISAIDDDARVFAGNAARRGKPVAFDGDGFVTIERGGVAFDFEDDARAWGAVLRLTT